MKGLIHAFLYLLLSQRCDATKQTLPVLMMDHDEVMSRVTIKPNPFAITTPEFFAELIAGAVKRSECVVIFIENSLCTEDISSKDNIGTPYYNMQKGVQDKKVVYLPAVTAPYDVLRQSFEPTVSNIFHLGYGEKLSIKEQHKYLYVYFHDESDMSRIDKLRKHDVLMKEVYLTVRQLKAGPVLAFYTGKKNSVSTKMLSFASNLDGEPRKDKGMLVVTPDALFRLTGVFSSVKTRRSAFEEVPVVEYAMRTRRSLSTTMLITDFHLQFNFEFQSDMWMLNNVALLEAGEEVGRTHTQIAAPWLRSYFCTEPITILNMRDGSSITISEYQIEPLPVTTISRQARRSNKIKTTTPDKKSKPPKITVTQGPIKPLPDIHLRRARNPDAQDEEKAEEDKEKAEGDKEKAEEDKEKAEGDKEKEGPDGDDPKPAPDKVNNGNPLSNVTRLQPPGHCFSTAVNCSPYFNTIILAGLMIVFLFLSISFWGVLMLLNCSRNDRFDDPTQKPLVIAQEASSGF